MLAANGTKLPVKLKMEARENAVTGKVTHVVQVSNYTCTQMLPYYGDM
jgi:hypothetical protein